jgi:hypothetical protein
MLLCLGAKQKPPGMAQQSLRQPLLRCNEGAQEKQRPSQSGMREKLRIECLQEGCRWELGPRTMIKIMECQGQFQELCYDVDKGYCWIAGKRTRWSDPLSLTRSRYASRTDDSPLCQPCNYVLRSPHVSRPACPLSPIPMSGVNIDATSGG